MTKVLFLNNSGDCWGGVEKWLLETGEELNKRGHQVFVAARSIAPLFKRAEKAGLKTKEITKLGSTTFLNPRRIFKFSRWLARQEIETIVFCSSPTFKFGTVAAKLAGVKNIIYRRGSAIPINDRFYNHWLLNWVTTFIANSKATGRESLKYMTEFPKDKVKLIYNGVKINKFTDPEIETDIRKEFAISNDELVLVNVGRLHKQKGQTYLLEAAAKLQEERDDFVILLVGDGPKETELKKLAAKLEVEEKIRFVGFRSDVPSILKQSDFMVHTARWEGFGFVIAEAMAAGIPVVATDCSNIPELITPGQDGYLAESENPADIAAKVLQMCESDIEVMGQEAEKTACKRFSFQRMVDQAEECIT